MRGRADQTVDRQAGGALEGGDARCACRGRSRRRSRPGPVAAPLEQELERRDVPAALPAVHDARAEARAAAPAERAPGLRSGDAVDEQAVALLEASALRCWRERALDPVHRDRVEAEGLERNLKRGHVGAARSSRLRQAQRERPCEDGHAGEVPERNAYLWCRGLPRGGQEAQPILQLRLAPGRRPRSRRRRALTALHPGRACRGAGRGPVTTTR